MKHAVSRSETFLHLRDARQHISFWHLLYKPNMVALYLQSTKTCLRMRNLKQKEHFIEHSVCINYAEGKQESRQANIQPMFVPIRYGRHGRIKVFPLGTLTIKSLF